MSPNVIAMDAIDVGTGRTQLLRPEAALWRTCRQKEASFPLELTMAFQPIVDVKSRRVYAYEALLRGTGGESAAEVLSQVTPENRYLFDRLCRAKTIEMAARLGVTGRGARLAVNCMPGAADSPAVGIRRTLAVAREYHFPLDHLIFELTETEEINTAHLQAISEECARHGFTLALDDFGAGYSGLNRLATLDRVGVVKLDGTLVRAAGKHPRGAAILSAIASLCTNLGIQLLGECVETVEEYRALRRCGVHLMQGYLFARPAIGRLPEVFWPEAAAVPGGPFAVAGENL